MSDVFMDMHRRRLSRAADLKKASSFQSIYGGSLSSSLTSSTISASAAATAATNDSNAKGNADAIDDDDVIDDVENNNIGVDDDEDPFANVLSLKLRKPKDWKWELTTSRSCSNIALPRILLYDHKGKLLVDANSQEEQVYKQPSDEKKSRTRKRSSRAATTNILQSLRQTLDRDFNDLQINEATPSPDRSGIVRLSPIRRTSSAAAGPIDFYTNELPDGQFERRSSSLKSVRFSVDDRRSDNATIATATTTPDATLSPQPAFDLANFPTPPSTSTTTTTARTTGTGSSSTSGPRKKRRYRRSRSSGQPPGQSNSILERFSFNKGRFSSPEYGEEQEVHHAPRYYLATSKAGTLVVQEQSFSRCRRRRKPRPNSSNENIGSNRAVKSPSVNSLKMSDGSALKIPNGNAIQGGSLQNITNGKDIQPVRRYRSDGNVMLLRRQLSSSEEEEEEQAKYDERQRRKHHYHNQQHLHINGNEIDLTTIDMPLTDGSGEQRRYPNLRRQSKKDLTTILDSENEIRHASANSTVR